MERLRIMERLRRTSNDEVVSTQYSVQSVVRTIGGCCVVLMEMGALIGIMLYAVH
jgi:hypothetical protein